MKTLTLCVLSLASLAWGQSAPVSLDISAGTIMATNLSSQPIVDIEVQYVGHTIPLSATRTANVVSYFNHDMLFKTPIGPGQRWEAVHYVEENAPYAASGYQVVLDDNHMPVLDSHGVPTVTPIQTHVTFLQYADGTTWGTPHIRTQAVLGKRKDRVTAMHTWLSAYQVGGSTGFLSALNAETNFGADAMKIAQQVQAGAGDKAASDLALRLASIDALMATGKF